LSITSNNRYWRLASIKEPYIAGCHYLEFAAEKFAYKRYVPRMGEKIQISALGKIKERFSRQKRRVWLTL
jgi:hypothetical protein